MKTILFIAIFFQVQAFSKCNSKAIEYKSEFDFSFSFGKKGESDSTGHIESVNLPIRINGKEACFKKLSSSQITNEKPENDNYFNFKISKMKVEFKNIPGPHVKQYIFIEKDPSNKLYTKVHSLNFICSEEMPLSVEAVSYSYLDLILKSEEVELRARKVFATGMAARILNEGRGEISNNQETFDFYTNLYYQMTKKELVDSPRDEINIPSILSETTIETLSSAHKKIALSYTSMDARVVNGCTLDFSKVMSNYLIENFKKNKTLSGIKVKNKSNVLIISDKK